MFTSALASTETAVVCCPSGFSVDPYAGCYSHFPVTSLADETGCYLSRSGGPVSQSMTTYTYEFWGESTTVTQNNIVFPTETDGDSVSRVTITFDESGVPPRSVAPIVALPSDGNETHVGIATVTPIYLVNSGEGGDGEGGDGDGEDGDGEDGDDEGGDGGNAAGRLSPVADWRPIAGVLGAWAVSVTAGLGLLAAW